ncbi:VanZ family protein [Terasakiella sp. A23]|uniref:VanZ family protein n=1 Tax=Terasakiella sp. FCG-A23 TaxID=3080561 RepID=UPI00295455B0|nr:VanZ family protein [Terasakiella sp. A23]MDV7339288.1 VanZ family protein [Terasakiella sp. A23]
MSEKVVQLLFYLACLILALLSLTPQEALPQSGLSDKIEHLLAYASLASLGIIAHPMRVRRISAMLIIYGSFLEAGQSLVPGRVPSLGDIIANALGVCLGVLVFFLYKYMRQKSSARDSKGT